MIQGRSLPKTSPTSLSHLFPCQKRPFAMQMVAFLLYGFAIVIPQLGYFFSNTHLFHRLSHIEAFYWRHGNHLYFIRHWRRSSGCINFKPFMVGYKSRCAPRKTTIETVWKQSGILLSWFVKGFQMILTLFIGISRSIRSVFCLQTWPTRAPDNISPKFLWTENRKRRLR